ELPAARRTEMDRPGRVVNRSLLIGICVVLALIILVRAPVATARLLFFVLVGIGLLVALTNYLSRAQVDRPAPAPRPKPPSEDQLRYQACRERIDSLPLAEARSRADAAPDRESEWMPGEDRPADPELVDMLPESVRRLLDARGPLRSAYGGTRIGASEIDWFDWPPPDVLGFGER